MILIKDSRSDRMMVNIDPEAYKFSVHSWMCDDVRCWHFDWCTSKDADPRRGAIHCEKYILLNVGVVDGTEI